MVYTPGTAHVLSVNNQVFNSHLSEVITDMLYNMYIILYHMIKYIYICVYMMHTYLR